MIKVQPTTNVQFVVIHDYLRKTTTLVARKIKYAYTSKLSLKS